MKSQYCGAGYKYLCFCNGPKSVGQVRFCKRDQFRPFQSGSVNLCDAQSKKTEKNKMLHSVCKYCKLLL